MVASWFDPVRRPKSRTPFPVTPDTVPSSATWLDDETRADIHAGDQRALLRAIGTLAGAWMRTAGTSPDCRRLVTCSETAGCLRNPTPTTPVQRAFLAAGCDVLDLLALSPEGRQAIHDLGFEPIAHHAKRKR